MQKYVIVILLCIIWIYSWGLFLTGVIQPGDFSMLTLLSIIASYITLNTGGTK